MPYFLRDNCVVEGTKDEPGETVECHETRAEALAHMRALYVNVEDADKGGTGSGWHGPPYGAHAGTGTGTPSAPSDPGPMAYEQGDSDAKQRHCKCSECGAVMTLPKGKQCRDLQCPACASAMAQLEPGQGKPAEGESGGAPGAGRKAQDTHDCRCPQCGAVVHVALGQKCNEVRCPECEAAMVQGSAGEKAAANEPGPTLHGSGGAVGEVASVMGDDDVGCKCPHCKASIPCAARICPECEGQIEREERGEGEKDVDEDESIQTAYVPARSTVYKSADGSWRWLALCNWAVVDKEAEVVSGAAYRDGIAKAHTSGQWGELDLVHVDGTDAGDCDMLFTTSRNGEPPKLGAGGTWYDTPRAVKARQAVQRDPDYWGMSIKFRYDPQRKVKGIYTGNIEFLKYTILPKAMAASYGTAIAVQGGEPMSKAMDDKTVEALGQLGLSEDEIEELAQKQKALPLEENVAQKEGEDTLEATEEEAKEENAEAPVTKATFWSWMKELAERIAQSPEKEEAPVASEPEEAGKADEVTDPAKAAQPADEKQAGGESDEASVGTDVLREALGEMAKALGETVRQELAVRDKRIAELEDKLAALDESVEEKVAQRLRDVPAGARVAPSQVQATVDTTEAPKGLTFGQRPAEAEKFARSLVAGIQQVVEQEVKGAQYTV